MKDIFSHCMKAIFSKIIQGKWDVQKDEATVFISIAEYFIEYPQDLDITEWCTFIECYWWLYENCLFKIKEELGDRYRKSLLKMYMISVDIALLAKCYQEGGYCIHFIWSAALFGEMWYPFLTDKNNDISEEEKRDFLMTTRYFSKRTCPFSQTTILNYLCEYHFIDILGLCQVTFHPKPQILSLILKEGGLSSTDFTRLKKSPFDVLSETVVVKFNELEEDGDKEPMSLDERLDLEKCAQILHSYDEGTSSENLAEILSMIRLEGLQQVSEESDMEEMEIDN